MKIKLTNGKTATIVDDVKVIIDNGDGYTYVVPAEDLVREVNTEPIIVGYKQIKTNDREVTYSNIIDLFVDHLQSFVNDEMGEIYEKLAQMGYKLEDIE